ncbi:hypothetical protein [uncultured Robinsoniella sp.]
MAGRNYQTLAAVAKWTRQRVHLVRCPRQ